MNEKKQRLPYMILLLSFSLVECATAPRGPQIPLCVKGECVDSSGKSMPQPNFSGLVCTSPEGMRELLEYCKLKSPTVP